MNTSVIIPTYNRYEFLKRALASVFTQSYLPKEVIVIDDGSTDKTSQIQKDFPPVTYIYQKNTGVSSARNLGIKNAKHEWIAFLDSDDTWDEDKLKKQIEFHKNYPEIHISYTDEKWIRNDKEVKIPKKFQKHGGHIFSHCLSHCIIAPSSSIIHKSLFEKVGTFDENLEVCEDYDLWIRIALKYEIGLINEPLITKYAGHENQLSFKFWGMDRFRVLALEKLLLHMYASPEHFFQGKFQSQVLELEAMLRQKYKLLLKGAIKYDKIQDIKNYEEKLKVYE